MSQDFDPTAQTEVSQPFLNSVYPGAYAGGPPVQAGCLWAVEFPRREVWVEGTAITNGASFNNLYAETGSPNNGTLLVSTNPLTYPDQVSNGKASGFQISSTTQNNGNLAQIDPGTGYFQGGSLTDDFFMSVANIFPNTAALDSGKWVLSKQSATSDTAAGMHIERAHGQTGGSPVQMIVKCSDSSNVADFSNNSVSPAGTGGGFHYMAFGRVSGTLYAFYDANPIGSAVPAVGTWTSNTLPLAWGGRPGASASNQILGMTMVASQGVNLTHSGAALGLDTISLMYKLALQEWTYLFGLYGAYV